MQSVESRRQFVKSYEAKSLRVRSILTRISDDLTSICGSVPFLLFHFILFSLWISVNTGNVPTMPPFDPFPFGLLTMVVSLEAIILSIFVLVAQNRSSYVGTIRDEVHMGINLIAEEEITKILEILVDIRKQMGINKNDPVLEKMLERTDTSYIERSITEQLERASKNRVNVGDVLLYPIKAPFMIVRGLVGNKELVETKEKV